VLFVLAESITPEKINRLLRQSAYLGVSAKICWVKKEVAKTCENGNSVEP
jgi:hypothetical protein